MVRILLVDDDTGTLENLALALRDEGYDVQTADNTAKALRALRARAVEVVITDVVMPDGSGMEILQHVRRHSLDCAVILMTGYGSVSAAVDAIRAGAFDYLTKPVNLDQLLDLVQKSLAGRATLAHDQRSRRALIDKFGGGRIIGESMAIQEVFARLEMIAATNATVLITGESGTGKELVADAIRLNSARADRPFVKLNCMAFADGVIESELFGHEKGAFTSAHRQRKGRFELADGGTLFIDEIGDLSLPVQVKLLRVLQEREIERVGGSQTIKVDVRLICATNRDLAEEVRKGRFREELYYRINVLRIDMPPLRARIDDLPPIIDHYLRQFNREHGQNVRGLTPKALSVLSRYRWPGNIRELRNLLESLVVTCHGTQIDARDLPEKIRECSENAELSVRIGQSLAEIEREVILRTIAAMGGNKTKAARVLGIGAKTLYRRLAEYGEMLQDDEDPA